MNKNAIQKYAVWARNELIEQIKQRAYQYGISEKSYGDENASVIAGRALSLEEMRQRKAFVAQIKEHGYQQAVEEVAYTWFNRFIALRFMEVNDYLPTHIRVFSDANGDFNPEILKEVLHLDLAGLDKTKVSTLLNANQAEELYRYLLLTQCNALNDALPDMFEKLGSYTEMLLPNNILKPESVLGRLVRDIPEEDFRDAVQIIGWLYQYYNTEPKQAVFDGLKKNVKISKDKIPAATQLFTPDWIVRYMVENSLGRLWLESHPNDKLKASWKYYLEEAEQTPEVAEHLRVLRAQSSVKSPEDIRLIDPCMGSGHILVYAFDVLMQIYESEGYSARDAAKLILEKNLYGIDIDDRAYQLSYFALMMKARQYDKRLFSHHVEPNICAVQESNGLHVREYEGERLSLLDLPRSVAEYLIEVFHDAKEYGSLLNVRDDQYDALSGYLEELQQEGASNLLLQGWLNTISERMPALIKQAKIMSMKYDVVVTNPPYMGGKGQSGAISDFLKNNYPDTKSDTFSAFIERCGDISKRNGFVGMFTPYVWMFIQSYEKLRNMLYTKKDILTLIQFEYSAFEEATVPVCTFAFRNQKTGMTGEYLRLVDFRGGMEVQREKTLEALADPKCGYRYTANSDNFEKIPGSPVAYWVSGAMLRTFINGKPLGELSRPRVGQNTGDNSRFLRLWFEVSSQDITFHLCTNDLERASYKWLPYNKGGDYRKWYGNQEYIINWAHNGTEIKNYAVIRNNGKHWSRYIQNVAYMCKSGITWTFISSSKFATRFLPNGFICDVAGSAIYPDEKHVYYLLGFLNTEICFQILMLMNPTLNFQAGNVAGLPIIVNDLDIITGIVQANISCSCRDWNSFETSWDFKRHPLVAYSYVAAERETPAIGNDGGIESNVATYRSIELAYESWEHEASERFNTLKANEEELNRIFINIYGLKNELTPEVEDKDVTVRRADLGREIRSLMSYAVGCMFGRYSLDVEGLAYAGGDWDASKYRSFIPDKDNILPVCDDEYFDDDITGRFVDFVRVVYGADTLEENLKFIADALGGKGTPREVIRNYFLNDFYADHCKIYQKRPIYWMVDSGKKNGFKALIYLHRYSLDLLAKLRTDYVHEQQERYRTQLSHILTALNTATGAERARLLKQQEKLTEQLKEITSFEEKVHHLADQNIEIDLDDGVKKNYELFADILAKI